MRILRLYSCVCIVALVAVPAWMFLQNPAVTRSHPLLPSLCGAALLAGLCWAVALVATRNRRPAPRRAHRVARMAGGVLWRTLVVAVTGVLLWLNPFAYIPSGGELPAGVQVAEGATSLTLSPTGAATSTGLVFYPGARVEALAYRDLLAPLAADGFTVVILKEPLGLSILDSGQAAGALADHPQTTSWAVGGHSLGGVSAGLFAGSHRAVSGLVLWGSYPVNDLSATTGLSALSVSGTDDGLSTPEKLAAARPLLPHPTTTVVVDGGIHAYFGDYGPQPGDGQPGTSRQAAQRQIVDATAHFLASLGR